MSIESDIDPVVSDVWLESIDPESNQKFWFNSLTGQSSWDNPNDAWVEEIDPETNDKFWFNSLTGQSTWDNPFTNSSVDLVDPVENYTHDNNDNNTYHNNDSNTRKKYKSKQEISERSRQLREAAKQRHKMNANATKDADIITIDDIKAFKLLNEIDGFSSIHDVKDNTSNCMEIKGIINTNTDVNSTSHNDDNDILSPSRPSIPHSSNKYDASQRVLTLSSNDDIDKYIEQLLHGVPEVPTKAATNNYKSSIPKLTMQNLSHSNSYNSRSPNTNNSSPNNNKASPHNNKASPNSKRNSPGLIRNQNETIISDIKLAPKYVPIMTKANINIINEKRIKKDKELEDERVKMMRRARCKDYGNKIKERLLLKKTANYDNDDKMIPLPLSYTPKSKPNISSLPDHSDKKDKKLIITKTKKVTNNNIISNNDSIFMKPGIRILKIDNNNDHNKKNSNILLSPVYGSAYIADCLAQDPYEEKLSNSYENEITKIFYQKMYNG